MPIHTDFKLIGMKKPDFETQTFLSSLDDSTFVRIHPIIQRYLPRVCRALPERRIRGYLDAILYLSRFHVSWRSVKRGRAIYRFYRRLRMSGAFEALQDALCCSLNIGCRKKRDMGRTDAFPEHEQDGPGRPRTCPACPYCGENTIRVTCTKQRGHMLNRWGICDSCGQSVRFVRAGEHGYWYRIKTFEDVKNRPVIP